ncbi:cytochrome P450 [Nocardia thailandica]|uniref:cytochrome P450 n=1 Tax=Nocardia thailandica TaxID=257275 RepID=UPI0002E78154|nr:cytochrome P450 [Nocardia thailandica]
MTSSAAGDRTLFPSRLLPAPMRWHATRVSWRESWRHAAQIVPRWRDRTLIDYLGAGLPGHDDVLVTRLPFQRFVVVRNPELARRILVTHVDNYCKSAEYDMMAVTFGQGLVTDTDEQRYQRNRRLVQPLFSRTTIERFDAPMVAAAEETVRRIRAADEDGRPVDIGAEMNRLTLDILARTMFGTDLSGPIAEIDLKRLLTYFGIGFATNVSRPLRALSTWVSRRVEAPERQPGSRLPIRAMRLLTWITAPHIMVELRRIERAVDGLVADHRAGRITGEDHLLGLLMAARDPETGHRYSDSEIHDELMTFIGAGMESTATALTWTWKLLADHPAARSRMLDEIATVLAGRAPRAADVDELVWTAAVFREAMRLYPPVVGLTRVARADDVLGGYRVKRGTTVIVSIPGVHLNPRVWDDAGTFDPTRYLPGNQTADRRHASLAFSAGKRICVAQGFAMMEAVLALATIAQALDLDPVTDEPVRRQMSFIGAPEKPLLMQATFRH